MTDRDGDIRVLIADDEALVRAGFMVLVDSAPGLSVVGQASDGVQAVRQARALKPDVVLMDIRMPVMGGLEATKLILDGDQDPPPRILVVTTFDEDEHVFEALRSGASGFVLKDTPPEKLLDAITVVAAGEALLAPAITRRLIAEFARRPRAAAPSAGDVLAPLTEREREVLQQVAAGSSNAEVAAALQLSVATVKTHISRLLSKLDCRDRAQLVVVAYETGVAVPAFAEHRRAEIQWDRRGPEPTIRPGRPEGLGYIRTLVEGAREYVRHTAVRRPDQLTTQHHGEADHLAWLERPFAEARRALEERGRE